MEVRKFEIAFYGVEWHIGSHDWDEEQDSGDLLKGVTKPMVTIKDNKIVYVFDISKPGDEEIDGCKKHKIFNEICEFNFFDSNVGEYTDIFQGTFIDALLYIQENFKARE